MEKAGGVTLQVVPLTVQGINGGTAQILALAPCSATVVPTQKTPTKILPKLESPSSANSIVGTPMRPERPIDVTKHILRCKRRLDFGKFGLPQHKPASVSRRNERERNRVKLVNASFDSLRQHIPLQTSKNKKISKVETLRLASEYIRQLQELLDGQDAVNAVLGSNSATAAPISPCTSTASSPTPSYSSYSSAEENMGPLSSEEEDLLDFDSWFS